MHEEICEVFDAGNVLDGAGRGTTGHQSVRQSRQRCASALLNQVQGKEEIQPIKPDRKSTRLNSSHTVIYTLSLPDALPISALVSFTDPSELQQERCMRKFARFLMLAMFSTALVVAPLATKAYANPDNDAPPPSSTKSKGKKKSSQLNQIGRAHV